MDTRALIPDSLIHRLETMDLLEEHRLEALESTKAQQSQPKVSYDKKLKLVYITAGDLVLVYDCRYLLFPGKLHTHWLSPYKVVTVWPNGSLTLQTLDGKLLETRINGFQVKKYFLPMVP